MPLEIEVKFLLINPDSVRSQIDSMNVDSSKIAFEKNVRFEDKNNSLYAQQSLLRLRQSDKITLTYKSMPEENHSEFKILNELEVNISDFDTMCKILECIGFYPVQIYEKQRETIHIKNVMLCFDKMPYGFFLELEGERAEIRAMAQRLNIEWHQRIILNYIEIFDILKKKHNLSFSDITFDNFKNINIDIEKHLPLFIAST